MANHTQQVVWTALPNGIGRKGPQLSVHVSPRLTVGGVPDTDLHNYPAWADWPSVMLKAAFGVRFGRQRVPARLVSKPDSRVWKAIFDPRTLVINHAFEDLSGRVAIAYSVAAMARRLRDVYSTVLGAHVSELPDVPTLRDMLHPFQVAPSGPDLLKTIASDGGKGYLGELDKAGIADLGLFNAYHAPYDLSAVPLGQQDARRARDGIDFHRIVAALAQYRRLLRDTGLVLDLELERELSPGAGALSVEVRWNHGPGVATERDTYPQTRTIYDEKRFEAEARGKHIVGRRLDLSDRRYTPVQVDIDGGILKLAGTGQSLRTREVRDNQLGGKSVDADDSVGLPTLRSTGIMVAETGRADALADRLGRASKFEAQMQAGKPVELFAEDIVRGYHVDVREGGTWRSLCRVDVTYEFRNGEKSGEEDVEGIVQLSASEAPLGSAPELANLLRFSEGLFQWDGWSLSAPRPGLAVDQSGRPQPGDEIPEFPVAAIERVHPKSLPRLRFGATYRIRARLVDLAHNAENWTARDVRGSTSDITYRRFEPVPPPVLALYRHFGHVDAPTHGGSLLRMVIRTGGATLDMPTGDVDSRLIYAPRASVEMAERHGALDDPDGRPRRDRYALLAGRDDDLEKVEVGPPEERKAYPVGDSFDASTPWLPDPMATHVQVALESNPPRYVSVPGTRLSNAHAHPVDPGADWPDPRPWTLKLREDPNRAERYIPHQGVDFNLGAATTWQEQSRTLTVWLPKGEIVRARLAHMFPGKPEPADLFGVAQWLKETLEVDAYESVRNVINSGRHWGITPALEIEMVHAVQRPLTAFAPSIAPPVRARGDSHAAISLSSPCHAESTADLILEGAWIEADDTHGTAPAARWQSGRAFRQVIGDRDTPDGIIHLSGRHAFGDTRYRRVNYRLKGASRFAEYFPPNVRNDADAISRTSEDVVAHVPNASPPPAPKVLHAVPVFDWLRNASAPNKASWRRVGIRVYLDRPWFQTGFGEMLAAILPRPGTSNAQLERIAPAITQWAGDPIWQSTGASGEIRSTAPTLADFPARSLPDDGPDERWPDIFPEEQRGLAGGNPVYHALILPDEAGNPLAQVDAAGHPVSWDAAGQRYYADLMMRTGGAYQPFVSLAVARLHPVSAPGCHLSPAVRLDTLQVLPERLATCRRASTGWMVQLYGHPHGYKEGVGPAGNDRPLGSVVRVEVQRASGAAPDELDWETVEDTTLAGAPDVSAVDPTTSATLPASYTAGALFGGQQGALRDDFALFVADGPKRLYAKRFRTPGAGGGDAGNDHWRIRVTEWERHKADDGPGNAQLTPASSERLVFAETFDVTP